jgi:radical SAM protein with 4Fe4S-binding SPASM domain
MEITSYREIIGRSFIESRPLNAQWELTFKCNHLCGFCYNAPTGQRELTTDEIKRGLEKILDLGVLYITLTGGEAMVRPDFFEICEHARHLGFALRVYSNGYLIDEEKARRLKEVDTFEMEISIHGAKPETHDRLTGIRGSFDRLIAGLGHLRKQRIKTSLKCPITHLNQDELHQIWDIARSFECSMSWDPVIMPRDDGDTSPLALSANKEFLDRFFSDEFKLLRHGADVEKRDDTVTLTNCGTGKVSFTIDPYGNIFPCVAWRRKWANIKDVENLAELWRSSEVLKQVRWAAEQIPKTTLKQAESGDFCNFCPGVAERQTGSPFKMYPQAEAVAEARLTAYNNKQAERTGDAGVSPALASHPCRRHS